MITLIYRLLRQWTRRIIVLIIVVPMILLLGLYVAVYHFCVKLNECCLYGIAMTIGKAGDKLFEWGDK